jgi:hypothetical protein
VGDDLISFDSDEKSIVRSSGRIAIDEHLRGISPEPQVWIATDP